VIDGGGAGAAGGAAAGGSAAGGEAGGGSAGGEAAGGSAAGGSAAGGSAAGGAAAGGSAAGGSAAGGLAAGGSAAGGSAAGGMTAGGSTAGGAAAGGTAAGCVLSPMFTRTAVLPWPAGAQDLPSIALADDGMAAVGLPVRFSSGAGSVALWNTNTNSVARLSTGFDAGLNRYGEAVAVPRALQVVAIGIPNTVPFAELVLPDGGLFDRPVRPPSSVFFTGTNVSLSGDARTMAWSGGIFIYTHEIFIRRPTGTTTATFPIINALFGRDFELDNSGQRLASLQCVQVDAGVFSTCRVVTYNDVSGNPFSRTMSDPLPFTVPYRNELEASSDATWVAVSDYAHDNDKGLLQVLRSFGTGYEVVYSRTGTLTQERLGLALAMDGTGQLLAVSNGRSESTSVLIQRPLGDGGLDYCEAQVLPAFVSNGRQLSLNSSGTRLVMITFDGGMQLFTR